LKRTDSSVPEEQLKEIQACFIAPPTRYISPVEQVLGHYEKADVLCRKAISSHPLAPDLWIVRNRRIVALLGLWKLKGEYRYFSSAVEEAKATMKTELPPGTDVIARFCLARESLRNAEVNSESVIRGLAEADGKQASAPELAAAALLALDVADRKLHEEYRRAYLDAYAEHPTMWTMTAFLLDRYHRYWMYHPPFVAGWTYGRRQGHFLAVGEPEDANRSLWFELDKLDGERVRIPKPGEDKWTIVSFAPNAQQSHYLARYGKFVEERPVDDVNLITAVLDEDVNATREVLEAKKTPDPFPTMHLRDGIRNPAVRKLGITLDGEDIEPNRRKPNLLLLRPDGSIALALSGSTMRYNKANVMQNVIELHDEKMVDEALVRGDIDEAKRLAFAHAPVEQVPPPDAPRSWKPKKISIPHLRSRAKVYLAMGELESAASDAEEIYLVVNQNAGYISMRTDELEEAEALRETIRRKKSDSDK
jgi:hypothetical protein